MRTNLWTATILLGFSSVFCGCMANTGGEEADEEVEEVSESALGANIIKNGGFESGWNYWDHESAKLMTGAGTYLRTYGYGSANQEVKVTAGKKYHLLVKTRHISGSQARCLSVNWCGADWCGSAKSVTAGTSGSWHWRSFDATAPAGATVAYVIMGRCGTPSSDDTPATYDWDGVEMHAY